MQVQLSENCANASCREEISGSDVLAVLFMVCNYDIAFKNIVMCSAISLLSQIPRKVPGKQEEDGSFLRRFPDTQVRAQDGAAGSWFQSCPELAVVTPGE